MPHPRSVRDDRSLVRCRERPPLRNKERQVPAHSTHTLCTRHVPCNTACTHFCVCVRIWSCFEGFRRVRYLGCLKYLQEGLLDGWNMYNVPSTKAWRLQTVCTIYSAFGEEIFVCLFQNTACTNSHTMLPTMHGIFNSLAKFRFAWSYA